MGTPLAIIDNLLDVAKLSITIWFGYRSSRFILNMKIAGVLSLSLVAVKLIHGEASDSGVHFNTGSDAELALNFGVDVVCFRSMSFWILGSVSCNAFH